MSFDIRLNSFSSDPPSDARCKDALAVLERYGAHPSERFDAYSVRWEDGFGFAMYSKTLTERQTPFYALLNPLGGLSQRFCDFAYDFASAMDCAIHPDSIPPLTIVVHSAMAARLPESVTRKQKVVRASSGVAIRNALAESYDSWRGLVRDTVQQLKELGRGSTGGA